jgi:hypothetical protein
MNKVQEYGLREGNQVVSGGLIGFEGRESAIKQAYLDPQSLRYGWQVVTRTLVRTDADGHLGERWGPAEDESGKWHADDTAPVTAALALVRKAADFADRAADVLTSDGWEADAFTEASVQQARSLQLEAVRLGRSRSVIERKALSAQGV